MKLTLKTIDIPNIVLREEDDENPKVLKFSDLYILEGPLGCGAFGFVISAIDKATKKRLALKVTIF